MTYLFDPDIDEEEDNLYLNDDLDRRRVEEDEEEIRIDYDPFDDEDDNLSDIDLDW